MYRTPSWSSRFRGCIEKGAREGLRAYVEWTLRFERGAREGYGSSTIDPFISPMTGLP